MKLRNLILLICITFLSYTVQASYIFIPMNSEQKNHLKAYGIMYSVLDQGVTGWWLLNYEGGSFAFPYAKEFERECVARNVSFRIISDAEFMHIREKIGNPDINEEAIKLEVAPKIAVYTPETDRRGERIRPWDDAVTLAMTYAEIPYETVYDREVLEDKLAEYDWLHLHHEDFTGQYGKFYRAYGSTKWYKDDVQRMEALASSLGFTKVSDLKLAVVKKIREFVGGGGFMFAMCSATDTYDIALAAENVDIVDEIFDGDPMDADPDSKLDFRNTFAFENFTLEKNPMIYDYSSIDNTKRSIKPDQDYFQLFDFSAKFDPVPTMLTQNHTRTVKGFMGQTTAFVKQYVKSSAIILGENKAANEVRYIHGKFGEGTWTFYSGHDPEDYRHLVGDPPTDLNLHPNSPGYRLILNNVLFPAARKKERKT